MTKTRMSALGGALLVGLLGGRLAHQARAEAYSSAHAGLTDSHASSVSSYDPNALAAVRTNLSLLAQRLAAIPPKAPLEREVLATLQESSQDREFRHELTLKDMYQKAPFLRDGARDFVLQTQDRMFAKNRLDRAGFMLDQMAEPEYLDALRATKRDTFLAIRNALSPEEFEALYHWKRDADPFDPEGATAQPTVTHEVTSQGSAKVPNQ